MRMLRFIAVCFIICGYIKPTYADGLSANPWGKNNTANTSETAAPSDAPLKANPWKDPKASHLVRFSDSADSAPQAPQSTHKSQAIRTRNRGSAHCCQSTSFVVK